MPPDPEFVASIICPRCHADLAPTDRTCRHCGASTSSASGDAAPLMAEVADVDAPPRAPLKDSPRFVLLILFGVAMFLALPMLWKSGGFSHRGKVIVTILVILYSIVVFWVFGLIMMWSYNSIRQSL